MSTVFMCVSVCTLTHMVFFRERGRWGTGAHGIPVDAYYSAWAPLFRGRDGAVCLPRGLGHTSSGTAPQRGGGPSPGDGGGGQGEEMSERPADRARVFPGEMTEVKEREGRARAKHVQCQVLLDGDGRLPEVAPWRMGSDTARVGL